jgi:hypothetical protein
MQVIIYPLGDTIAVVTPVAETLPIEELAKKDVPSGVPFLIIDRSELPEDQTYRNAWTADFSSPDGYGIGQDEWFLQNTQG